MKKNLRLLIVVLFCALFVTGQPVKADGGTTCGTSTVALEGINHSNHAGSVDQWFTYTPTANSLITVSSCGFTNIETSFEISDNCMWYNFTSNQCGTVAPYQSNRVFQANAGQPFLIRWESLGSSAAYNWSLTV